MRHRRRISVVFFALWFALPLATAASPVKTEEEAIRLVVAAVHRFELTNLRDECWVMGVTERPTYFDFAVRELHTPSCGGAPELQLRIFSVRVMKRDGRMISDVYDGVYYRPLNHKPRAR